jgi:flagellar basal-body rod protein FlgB
MDFPGADNITSLLGTFLDVQSRRAEVVAGNLANADTPGYAAKEVNFADFLRDAATQSLQPGGSSNRANTLQVTEQQSAALTPDGNTVDVTHEMSTLAEAGMKYLEGTQLLQMRLRTLRTAIREGK